MIKNENTKIISINIEYNLISNYKFINKLNQNILYYKYLITKNSIKIKEWNIEKNISIFLITNSIITIPLLYNFYKR